MAEQEIEPFAYQKSTNIDEHNQIVDKLNEVVGVINNTNLDTINEKVATLESNVATNTSDIDSLSDTVDAQATQINTNKTNIESLRDANLIITKDITAIKEVNTEQNKEITALGNADIASMGSSFDTDTRDLKLTLNPVSGTVIETTVNIPGGSGTADVTGTAPINVSNNNVSLNINSSTLKVDDNGQLTVIGGGGGGGGDYSATLPITIADNAIGIAYDDTLVLKDNKLSVVNTGTDYVAGTGITINDVTIAVDETVIATKASVDTANITISEHTSDIASLEQKYDSQQTAITELSTGVSNAISTANTANTTAESAYASASISDNHLVLTKGNGNSDEIVLPSANDGWEEIDVNNMPNDFSYGDMIRLVLPSFTLSGTVSSWSTKPSAATLNPYFSSSEESNYYFIVDFILGWQDNIYTPIAIKPYIVSGQTVAYSVFLISYINTYKHWNGTSTGNAALVLQHHIINAGGAAVGVYNIGREEQYNTFASAIYKMYRKKLAS